jgi:hypothetical protein
MMTKSFDIKWKVKAKIKSSNNKITCLHEQKMLYLVPYKVSIHTSSLIPTLKGKDIQVPIVEKTYSTPFSA